MATRRKTPVVNTFDAKKHVADMIVKSIDYQDINVSSTVCVEISDNGTMLEAFIFNELSDEEIDNLASVLKELNKVTPKL